MPETTFPLSSKFTISFNAHEDRLCLACQLAGDQKCVVLLTRRMVRLVLQHLTKYLTKFQSEPNAVDQGERINPSSGQVLSSSILAQDPSVVDSIGKQPEQAVQVDDSSAKFLATELTLQLKEASLILAFRGFQSESSVAIDDIQPIVAFNLDRNLAAKWLEALSMQAQRAQWDLALENSHATKLTDPGVVTPGWVH